MRYAFYALAFLALFIVLPSLVLVLKLFKRKSVVDFDRSKRGSFGTYAPYMDEILDSIAYLRSLEPKTVSIESGGVLLKADWYDAGSKFTAVLLHGFCSSPMNNFAVIGRAFVDRGFNALIVHQRAHNASGGDFIALGIVEQNDLIKWTDWLKANTPTKSAVVYGISMGGATIAYAADKLDTDLVRAAVIESSYDTPYSQMYKGKGLMAVVWVPLMPFISFFSKLIYGVEIKSSVLPSLQKTTIPVLFLASENDKRVPLKLFKKTSESCASDSEFIVSRGAPHALAFTALDGDGRKKVFDFINKHIK